MEFIGLLFGMFVVLGIAGGLGALIAVFVWRLLRRNHTQRKQAGLIGAVLPCLCVIYLFACIAVMSGETVFGDISQPLPNGYSLQALGKMPDFASINRGNSLSNGQVPLTECVGSLAVAGPLVAGAYSHPFDSFEAKANEGFFIFDTRDGRHIDYQDRAAFEKALGHTVHLVPTSSFQSEEASYKTQQEFNHRVIFGPIIAAWITYILWLIHLRRAHG